MKVFLGIDWGGTYIKAAVLDSKGKIHSKKVFASEELRKKKTINVKLNSMWADLKKIKINKYLSLRDVIKNISLKIKPIFNEINQEKKVQN